MTRMLFDDGIFVNPVVSPAVSKENCMLRFSLMATHTKEQVQIGLEKIEKAAKNLGVLSTADVMNREDI